MGKAIIDNSTLTAVQRLLGQIPIYNKHAIDGDILAFETFIQAILFSDQVYFVNDYKLEYRDKRNEFFNGLKKMDLADDEYKLLLQQTSKFADDIIPQIKGGDFIDPDFKAFFKLLRMNNVFTWDISSSVFYLTQKMLLDSRNELDIDKYSKLTQMIFNEINDQFVRQESKSPLILDSLGRPIPDSYEVRNAEGKLQEAHIGKQVKLLMANLSWLAYRTIFYTLMAERTGGSLILHPIRNSFQINFLLKICPQSTVLFRKLIKMMNSSVESTVCSIFEPTQPLITKFSLPMFSVWLTNQAGNPAKAIQLAYQLKEESDFVNARKKLSEIEELFAIKNYKKAITVSNGLILEVNKLMNRIREKYNITTSQGTSLSPIIVAYNLTSAITAGVLPPIPDYSGKFKVLDKIKDLIPQRGFNGVYKSLINDLTQIGELGKYHEMLTSQIVYHEHADFYDSKQEDEHYKKIKSWWKVPM